MYNALKRALHTASPQRHVTIHTDSLYAMHMATGTWMPRNKGRRNASFVRRLRALWRQVQRKAPGTTRMQHVRSHTLVPGNELANWLADGGQHDDQTATVEETRHKAQQWLRLHPLPRSHADRPRASARPPAWSRADAHRRTPLA